VFCYKYLPLLLKNRRVVLITNVKPGKLRDVMSAGLVCFICILLYLCFIPQQIILNYVYLSVYHSFQKYYCVEILNARSMQASVHKKKVHTSLGVARQNSYTSTELHTLFMNVLNFILVNSKIAIITVLTEENDKLMLK
jgi:hypothetical protein